MTRHALVPLLLIALAPLLPAQESTVDDEQLVTALTEMLEREALRDRFSGAVLLAKGDEILFQKAYGLASRRFDVPNRVDTKFNLGSMNKMFTGVAVCQLAQKGLLAFDDRIIDHLPDYPNREVAEKVTIHHLLTHSSGLGTFWNEKFEATWSRLRTVADHLPLFVNDPLNFEPGSRFGYSNAGPVVLGLIIEKVTGQTYYDYVREQVYGPAKMKDTDCYAMDEPVPNLAIGYTQVSPGHERDSDGSWGPWRNNLFLHRVKGGPAGGGFSTVGDLFRFARALQAHQLLSPEMTNTLLMGKMQMGPGAKYAYLFGDHTRGGHRFHGHNGGASGISAVLSFYPDLGYTVAVLANISAAAEPIATFIRSTIEGRPATVAGQAETEAPPYRLGVGLEADGCVVTVSFAVHGGPAEKAGLLPGDTLLAMNGEEVVDSELVARLDALLQSPDEILFRVRRDGEEFDVPVEPERRAKVVAIEALVGTWQMETAFGDQAIPATMILKKEGGALAGTWQSMGSEMLLEDIVLEGDRLRFARRMGEDGPKMQFEGRIRGDVIEGAYDFQGRELICTGKRGGDPKDASPRAPLTLLTAATFPPQDDNFGIEVYEYLDGLHQDGFAGIVLVVKGDERLFAEGFGFANREEETPWTTKTHSTVGSISKQFTAAAILKLGEKKKLSVEDPLGKFFEEAPKDKREITLHQLLTHSSGISEYGMRLRDTDWIGRDQLVSTVLEKPLQFQPGKRYEYSNAGYSILAAIVEQVSGKGFEAFLVEELFHPAGMKETGFLLPEYDRERLAVGYRQGKRWGIMLDDMYFEDGPSWLLRGNGGVYSTTEEMHRWVRALAAGTVLDEESVEQLWTPYVDESNGSVKFKSGYEYFYGYGWSIFETRGGDKVVWHNGNDAGPSFFNDMAWVPEQQVFVMLQTNTYEGPVEDIVLRILQRLLSGTPLPG